MPGWLGEWNVAPPVSPGPGPSPGPSWALTSLTSPIVSWWGYEGPAPFWWDQYGSGPADATWRAVNEIVLMPYLCPTDVDVVQAFITNGAAVSGNVDLGIYSVSGTTATRLMHTGALDNTTAGTAGLTVAPVTYTVPSLTNLMLACVCDNTTQRYRGTQPSSRTGALQMYVASATAFPLPTSLTIQIATATTFILPFWGFTAAAVI